jgi:hypothetical protein
MIRPGPGLVQSLIIKGQRRMLDELGRAVGTEVAYLKAAWADPVLHGGRGERTGNDVDVLVRPAAAVAFAAGLEREGFRIERPRWQAATIVGNHAWNHLAPPGLLPVDLHLQLADAPWFDLSTDGCLDRAIAYDSVDGPILSLCPEDQVLCAAAHYANHAYVIDGRHLGDVERLCAQRPIDWDQTWERARPAGLEVPLALLVDALIARGVPVPEPMKTCGPLARLRLARSRRWVATSPELHRKDRYLAAYDKLARFPCLTNRPTALPRYVLRYGFVRLLDVAVELTVRLGA